MPINTRKTVNELGTIIHEVSFFDEDGTACAPTAVYWTLTDDGGVIINSRHHVTLTPLATIMNVVVTGNDCAILGETDNGERIILLEWTYNSTLGSGLAGTEEILFNVRNTRHGG